MTLARLHYRIFPGVCAFGFALTPQGVQILSGLHAHSHLAQKRAADRSRWGLWYRPYLHGSDPWFGKSHPKGARRRGPAVGAGETAFKEDILAVECKVDPGDSGGDLCCWSATTLGGAWPDLRRWRPRRWRS